MIIVGYRVESVNKTEQIGKTTRLYQVLTRVTSVSTSGETCTVILTYKSLYSGCRKGQQIVILLQSSCRLTFKLCHVYS